MFSLRYEALSAAAAAPKALETSDFRRPDAATLYTLCSFVYSVVFLLKFVSNSNVDGVRMAKFAKFYQKSGLCFPSSGYIPAQKWNFWKNDATDEIFPQKIFEKIA